ncbi:MAG: hypothetical protein KGD60_14835 [Candidatus Thorarchaeota archaeon]|nr:hypothetical protein [Candidatus Thorarchaeota archaeon]
MTLHQFRKKGIDEVSIVEGRLTEFRIDQAELCGPGDMYLNLPTALSYSPALV